MKFKEDIRFYTDDTKTVELMRLKARQRFDPRARYDITDDRGTKIGEIQKVFGESLMRSTYRLYDPNGEELATARERNVGIALFRRLVGFIPYIGDFSDWLPIPYHFDFVHDGAVLGTHVRRTGPQVPRRLRHRHERRQGPPARPSSRAGQRDRDGRAPGALNLSRRRGAAPARGATRAAAP